MASAPRRSGSSSKDGGDPSDDTNNSISDFDPETSLGNQPGHYETEQLINAVEKITDLLRKCWGVAGAGIISSNLARQENGLATVFNPTVPGTAVYALFAFAAIKGFDTQLRALGGDIMILINDVAHVLHKEVYRWGFGDSGQCNKNLGGLFLMVFKIGDVKEVQEKKNKATDVIFSSANNEIAKKGLNSKRRKHGKSDTDSKTASRNSVHGTMSLASLPGIHKFTDLAVLGMLKTYAGIYRDQKLLNWKEDFRLGFGAFSVDMIFGMDAGWAVEGAVGSEHKIDATYLSPHVNMASRMMSATKQYGINILLSQAVEELLSDQAKAKMRHVDTVTVKGSSVKQRIYTYDARHKGVDFFLFQKSDSQEDFDAEQYEPNLWDNDMDLRGMRQHVTDEFMDEFNMGRKLYLQGNWSKAVKHLKAADMIMVANVTESGYMDEDWSIILELKKKGQDVQAEEAQHRNEVGDGPSRRLLAFIESNQGVPPKSWKGFRPLTSK